MAEPLLLALGEYDGKRVQVLERIRDARLKSPEELREGIQAAIQLSAHAEKDVSAGASWLFRAWVEKGAPFGDAEARLLVDCLPGVEHPWARLHLCQTVRSLVIPGVLAPPLGHFLAECRKSDRPFLRAWSTDGLHHLANQHPRFEEAASEALEAALSDAAASVRARARKTIEGK